jgi:hypothetical protein
MLKQEEVDYIVNDVSGDYYFFSSKSLQFEYQPPIRPDNLRWIPISFLYFQCYMKFNQPGKDGAPRSYPLCAAELKDIMDASVNTETCRRRTLHITNLNPGETVQ